MRRNDARIPMLVSWRVSRASGSEQNPNESGEAGTPAVDMYAAWWPLRPAEIMPTDENQRGKVVTRSG
jgi:hypothetical protein